MQYDTERLLFATSCCNQLKKAYITPPSLLPAYITARWSQAVSFIGNKM